MNVVWGFKGNRGACVRARAVVTLEMACTQNCALDMRAFSMLWRACIAFIEILDINVAVVRVWLLHACTRVPWALAGVEGGAAVGAHALGLMPYHHRHRESTFAKSLPAECGDVRKHFHLNTAVLPLTGFVFREAIQLRVHFSSVYKVAIFQKMHHSNNIF